MLILTAVWSFALECGDWNATWYCIDCYMRYSICSIARAAKKALYAHGNGQNAIRGNESTLCDVTRLNCVTVAFVLTMVRVMVPFVRALHLHVLYTYSYIYAYIYLS